MQKRTIAADTQLDGLPMHLLLPDCMAKYASIMDLSYHNPALHSKLSVVVSCQSPASRSESFLD